MIAAIANPEKSYVARASVSNLRSLRKTLTKALKNVEEGGFSFVEVLSLCPLNWRTNNVDTWERLKTMEEVFPVAELLSKEGL